MTLLALISLFFIFSVNAQAPKAIYGEDNRLDTKDVKSPLLKALAQSSAAQVHKSQMEVKGTEVILHGPTLDEEFSLCEEERFRDQVTASNCSGVLVAPDIIATAGHCYAGNECRDYD